MKVKNLYRDVTKRAIFLSFCPYRATGVLPWFPGRLPGLGASALSGRVFKIYIIFRHVFCVKIQVKSHEINVL